MHEKTLNCLQGNQGSGANRCTLWKKGIQKWYNKLIVKPDDSYIIFLISLLYNDKNNLKKNILWCVISTILATRDLQKTKFWIKLGPAIKKEEWRLYQQFFIFTRWIKTRKKEWWIARKKEWWVIRVQRLYATTTSRSSKRHLI